MKSNEIENVKQDQNEANQGAAQGGFFQKFLSCFNFTIKTAQTLEPFVVDGAKLAQAIFEACEKKNITDPVVQQKFIESAQTLIKDGVTTTKPGFEKWVAGIVNTHAKLVNEHNQLSEVPFGVGKQQMIQDQSKLMQSPDKLKTSKLDISKLDSQLKIECTKYKFTNEQETQITQYVKQISTQCCFKTAKDLEKFVTSQVKTLNDTFLSQQKVQSDVDQLQNIKQNILSVHDIPAQIQQEQVKLLGGENVIDEGDAHNQI